LRRAKESNAGTSLFCAPATVDATDFAQPIRNTPTVASITSPNSAGPRLGSLLYCGTRRRSSLSAGLGRHTRGVGAYAALRGSELVARGAAVPGVGPPCVPAPAAAPGAPAAVAPSAAPGAAGEAEAQLRPGRRQAPWRRAAHRGVPRHRRRRPKVRAARRRRRGAERHQSRGSG